MPTCSVLNFKAIAVKKTVESCCTGRAAMYPQQGFVGPTIPNSLVMCDFFSFLLNKQWSSHLCTHAHLLPCVEGLIGCLYLSGWPGQEPSSIFCYLEEGKDKLIIYLDVFPTPQLIAYISTLEMARPTWYSTKISISYSAATNLISEYFATRA